MKKPAKKKLIETIDLDSKPQLTIDMPPLIEAYCRFEFNTNENQKEITISRSHPIAEIIFARIEFSHFRPKQSSYMNPVTFILPIDEENHHVLQKNFISIDAFKQKQIFWEIRYWFIKWLNDCFHEGYKMNMKQDDIVESILVGLNKRINAANSDAIKKFDYRNRRTNAKQRFKLILTNIKRKSYKIV